MQKSYSWIESGGGPLILLDEALLQYWQGVDGSWSRASSTFNVGEGPSDYDRACAIRDQVGTIIVGTGVGIILNEEPLPTTCVQLGDGDTVLARWVSAESDDDMAVVLSDVDKVRFAGASQVYEPQGDVRLFDSAFPGSDIRTPSLKIALRPGRYLIQTAHLQPNDLTSVILHKLKLI